MSDTHQGQLARFYYLIGDTDLSVSDGDVLEDPVWIEFCVIDVSIPKSNETTEILDRCSPTQRVYAPNKATWALTLNVNEFRIDHTTLKAWQAAIDGGTIISILALNKPRTPSTTDVWGIAMNALVTQEEDTQPQEGPIVIAYTFQPNADAAASPNSRRVYGLAAGGGAAT